MNKREAKRRVFAYLALWLDHGDEPVPGEMLGPGDHTSADLDRIYNAKEEIADEFVRRAGPEYDKAVEWFIGSTE